MAVNGPWPDPNAPQQGFSLPVSIGPMAFPVEKPKRGWRAIVAWSLCLFAGGIAFGPALQDYAYEGIDAAAFFVVTNAPPWLTQYIPLSPEHSPAPSRTAAVPRAAEPAMDPEAQPAEPARADPSAPPEPIAAKRPTPVVAKVRPVDTESQAPPTAEASPRPSSQSRHGKPVAKASAHDSLSAPPTHKGKQSDPFDTGSGHAEAAAPKREAAVTSVPPKSEPAPKRTRSNEGLDDLMAGMGSDGAPTGKGKRNTSKDIDAMLKDVQKSQPPPPPKKSEPAPLPALTASDIAKAMDGVKTRANECGKRLGQKGMAELKLSVGKDGRVSNVTVAGKSAGSPLGECVAKAARAASFPPNPGLKFDYRIDVR